MTNVVQIGRHEYIHVLDENKVVTRLVCGPHTFIKLAHERVVRGCTPMIEIHPMHYCKIQNPVVMADDQPVEAFDGGQVQLRMGETEIRFHRSKPFPLYPGEKMVGAVTKQAFIQKDTAYLVQALRDFTDELSSTKKVQRLAGQSWQVDGPKTYTERVAVKVLGTVKGRVIKEGCALMVTAQRSLKDYEGIQRHAGERWLIRTEGCYLPRLYEQIVEVVKGQVITHKTALQLRAKSNFTDFYGVKRSAGEEWLVTSGMAVTHIVDVYEESVKTVYNTTLSNRQYCVILDPYDDKKKCNAYGKKELRKGELTFFLAPGETLQNGVQDIKVLSEDEALLLKAKENCTDLQGKHQAGERWLVTGPTEYIPQIEVEIIERRKSIPLDKNEGIYVRNLDTGAVTAITGQTYMLQANEVLWEKELPTVIEEQIMLQQQGKSGQNLDTGKVRKAQKHSRDKTRVVTYKVPQNSAIQLYDYKTGKKQVVFGPGLILLEPNQEFTLIELSGGTPKVEGQIKTLAMQLGPDFMTDVVEVETSDHAKLSLQLCYNWHFKVDRANDDEVNKLFCVGDFVGNCCKNIASRVRGAVSRETFEDFQKDSENIIKRGVFGRNKKSEDENELNTLVRFPNNNLFITSVDVKSSQPIDEEVQRNLERSIAVSMDMTTKSAEAKARQEAKVLEQRNVGKLQCQMLEDQTKAESARQSLLNVKAQTLKLELSGKARATAMAQSQKAQIIGEAQVNQAKLEAEAQEIQAKQELQMLKRQQEAQLETMKMKNDLEINTAVKMAEIEINKFKQIIGAIGKETLVAISKSGPEMKAKMLKGLGLKGFLVTDGKNPINLFNTANGMLGNMGQQ